MRCLYIISLRRNEIWFHCVWKRIPLIRNGRAINTWEWCRAREWYQGSIRASQLVSKDLGIRAPDGVLRKDWSGKSTHNCQQDVDEEVGTTTTFEEDSERWKDEGEDDLADVSVNMVSDWDSKELPFATSIRQICRNWRLSLRKAFQIDIRCGESHSCDYPIVLMRKERRMGWIDGKVMRGAGVEVPANYGRSSFSIE